jgi:hypothetical protein
MKPLDLNRLLFRAQYRCEYCQTVLYEMSWHREHVQPRSADGADIFSNLAVSCPRCNLNKAKKTEGKDYVTGKFVRFFNPRTDRWKDHFGIVAGQLVGKSPIGRATASVLFRRTEQQLPPDLNWWPLREIDNETLYMFLNHQRARRLANQFIHLQEALNKIPFLKALRDKDLQAATFASFILIAESLYTRSRISDIRKALRIIEAVSKYPELDIARRAELLNITSVVLQQLSTTLRLEGRTAEADRAQKQAITAFQGRLGIIGTNTLKDTLRLASMKGKIGDAGSIDFKKYVTQAREEVSESQYGGYMYLADTEVG